MIGFNVWSRAASRWHGLRTKLLSYFLPQLGIFADIADVYPVERKTTCEKSFIVARDAIASENCAVRGISGSDAWGLLSLQ
jgi:hypothetical protein